MTRGRLISSWRRSHRDRAAQLREEPARCPWAAATGCGGEHARTRRAAAASPAAEGPTGAAADERAGGHEALQPAGVAQLLDQRAVLSTGQLHHEVQPGRERGCR